MFRERIEVQGYEDVYRYIDEDFHAFIALHSTKLGPALGGCRVRQYDNDEAALADVLELSRGMTYKNSVAGLNYGGGKCVVNASKATPEIMLKVGDAVAELGGTYITGEDVGTTVADMRLVGERTPHVLSLGPIGDPSPWTALGVFACIKSARSLQYLPKTKLSVWVQGLGKVGWALCEHLHKAGYKLYVSDIVQDRVWAALGAFNAVQYEDHYFDDIDIYAPCALGQVIREDNLKRMPPIICGSANNQLADDGLADRLESAGILYCPDYIVNAGGVIAAAAELSGDDEETVRKNVTARGKVLLNAVRLGEMNGKSPLWGAQKLAMLRL